MKKTILTITTIACLLVVFSGCKKILEVKPQSSITEEIYFQNEGDFEPYLTGIYTFMRSFANNVVYGTERSEELIAASNSRFGVAWAQNITPSSGAVNYNDWYKAIGHCNLLLAKIEGFSFASNPDTKKTHPGGDAFAAGFLLFSFNPHYWRCAADVAGSGR